MAATTLAAGELAIIGYNTEDTGSPGLDSISFVLLKPIGSGTQIFFTDRSWDGTAFAVAGGGEGTITYTAGADLPAGTVITITQAQLTAAGMALLDTGESIYAYQGAINAPTNFLFAVDVADGNTTFTGSLANTGLSVAAGTAAAIGADNAAFGTRGYNIQLPTLLQQIANAGDWVQNDNSPQPSPYTNGSNFFTAPDKQIWVASSGAGEALTILNIDGTVNSSNTAYQITHAFQNDGNLFHPSDITLDTVNDKFFFIDADLAGHNRIVQGSISQVLNNPGAALTLTVLYSNTDSDATNSMRTLSIDPASQQIYFDLGTTFVKVNYTSASQTPTVLADLGAGHYITQATIDYTNGEVYLGSSSVSTFFGSDIVDTNYIYKATGLTSSSSSLTFSQLPFNPDDAGLGPEGAPLLGEAWPVERGTIRGIDVDPVNHDLYIVTGTVIIDNNGNGLTTYYGGVYKYDLDSNAAGAVTTLFQQDGTNGPVGLLYYIEVDPSTGKYYVADETGTAAVGDGGIWVGSTSGGTPPTLLGTVGNINGLGPQGLEIQDAPNIDSATNLAPTITETAGNPSPAPTAVQAASTFTLSDVDSAAGSSNLAGAQVRISTNFQSGATHQDVLTISGAMSGTSNGITFSYDSTTGVVTMTGIATFAAYSAVMSLVRYTFTGDNPTNYGTAGTRTLSYSTFDGLLRSDEFNASVTVTGVNDAPVNTTGSAAAAAEDSSSNAMSGISVFDVDANPATHDIRVTLSVSHGTITILTNVAGGIVAGDITGGANGSSTITITATQDQINATLADASGLVYTPTANFNGSDALIIVTNDLGLNGNDAGLSGDGTSEQHSASKTINVSAVNDAPVVAGDGAEDATTINEDLPSPVGQTVSSLFGVQFSDATDDQTAFSGSSANTLAGIAVIDNGSSDATGQWQFLNGASWTDIGTATADAAQLITAATAIRFNPALNFNGTAPTLTARLVDNSGAAFGNGDDVDLTSAFGGTTRYSTNTVVLSQAVTPINDAPTSTNIQGDSATYTEASAAVLLDLGSNATIADVDSANFDGGTLTVSIASGVVTGEDQLGIDTSGAVTVAAGTVSVGGTAIGTYTGGGAGGGNLIFTLNANAMPAAVQALVRALTYSNSETETPTGGARGIWLTLVDGDGNDVGLGADTLTVTSSVTVVPVNDAPAGADNSATLSEDATYVFTTADFATGFSDIEGDVFAGVKIVTMPGANLMFDADGAGAGAAVQVTANDVISAADIAAGKLTFVPTAHESGSPYTSFSFAVQDDGGVLNGGQDFDQSPATFTLNVTPVNDAPDVTLPATFDANEQAPLNLKGTITVSDVDAGSATLAATLSVTFGVLDVQAGDSGATVVSGNGTDTVVITGSQAQIQTLLNSGTSVVNFTANSDTPPPSATITLSVADGGASGGAEATGDDNATINIASVNDAPAGKDNNTISVSEDDPYTFTAADFGFSDTDGNAFAGVVITTVATDGVLLLDGVTSVMLGQFISAADIAANRLTFMPSPDEYGPAYAKFTFQVRDDGGILNGGADTDPTANTITIDVIPDNLLPVVDLDGGTGSFDYATSFTEDSATPIAIGVGIGVSDLDPGATIASAVVTLTDALAGETLSVEGMLPVGIGLDITGTILTLSGVGTPADYATALQQVRFSSTNQNPTGNGATPTRTITTVVNDGIGNSAAATTTVTMTSVNDVHTGGAAIAGTAAEDAVLTAVSTLADADGLGALHYQWQRDSDGAGFINVGADQDTYTLGDGDVGALFRVTISYTDAGGTVESATSTATGPIAAVNDPHTGGVSITGTVTEDQVLTAVSTLTDVDGLGTLHYQWQRNSDSGFSNVGTDQATYILGDADVGGTIRVVVSYTDGQGFAESATSAATSAVANINDVPTGGAAITGTQAEDQVLTAVSTLADNDGLGTLHYQWQRNSGPGFVSVGADQDTYTLGDADVGYLIRVIISYTDGHGTVESTASAETGAISGVNDAPSGGVSITGTAEEDAVLTAVSTLADADGLGALHYQWQRDSDGAGFISVGADQDTYTLGDADVGGVVRVVISYTDGQGTAEAVTSVATAAIIAINDPHTGGAFITGTATEDQVLTAVSTLADVDGLGTLHYQWQHDVGLGFVNVGADQSTYTLSDADVDGVVRVVISYTDGQGFAESATSADTDAVANVNDAPTGEVTVSGNPIEGQTLTVTNTLADMDGLDTITYQWQEDGSDIVGATNDTLLLTHAQIGKAITVLAQYTDGHGTAEAPSSAPTADVANFNDLPTGTVTITGTPIQGQILTAANTLDDLDGMGAITYQWQANGMDIGGATNSTLFLTQAQVGKTITVLAKYTDLQGTAEAPSSAATAAVANVNDAPTGSVIISGTAAQGQILTAANTLSDPDGLGTISYQWHEGGMVIAGATGNTLLLGQAQVGKTITAVASYTDAQGTLESISSDATVSVANVNDAATGGVTISGIAADGQTLTADNTLDDVDGLGPIGYQWMQDGVDIVGATSGTLLLTQSQVGKAITVVASYTDAQGTPEAVSSAATTVVANVNDAPTGAVTISGTLIQGQTLTAANTLADADGLGPITYQWRQNGVNIAGATAGTLLLGQSQVGQTITVLASYTDGQGAAESLSSAATAMVANVNDAPTGTVTISGIPTQGQTLTAANTLADVDGMGPIAYQWLRDGTPIAGADATTYLLIGADVGKTMSVRASYIDGGSTPEAVTSVGVLAQAVLPPGEVVPPGTSSLIIEAQRFDLPLVDGIPAMGQLMLVADSVGGLIDPDPSTAFITQFGQSAGPESRGVLNALGTVAFRFDLNEAGNTETFSFLFDSDVAQNGYWVVNAQGHTVNLAASALGGAAVLDGDKMRLDFTITDGGEFDLDGAVDGSIASQGFIGVMTLSFIGHTPDTGDGFALF